MTARGNNPTHPWVQPIVVDKAGTHEATVAAVARASVAVWDVPGSHPDFGPSNFKHWLDGPFTKTVRRASTAQMAGLLQWAIDEHVPHALVSSGPTSSVVAFPPVRYEDMPKQIAKFQVHGTDFPRAEDRSRLIELNDDPAAPVIVWVDEALTTGKAAAAAAHALWAWHAHRARHFRTGHAAELWDAAGQPFQLHFVDAAFLTAVATTASAHPIVDSGLTEVDPGTLTAVATPRPPEDT